MDKVAFDNFLRDRYQSRVTFFRKRALHHQLFYTRLQWSIFIFSALNTILLSLQQFFDWIPIKILTVLFSLMISISAGIFTFFNPQEKWALYNRMISDLESEYDLYKAESDDYAQARDKESLFVIRINEILKKATDSMPYATQDEE